MSIVLLALAVSPPARAEIGVTTNGVWEITNAAQSNIGWLVVIGGSDVVANGHTWDANTMYWFFDVGLPFPGNFRVYNYGTQVPNRDPAGADGHVTSGPFDTSGTVTPHTGGSWWSVTQYIGSNPTSLGYVCNDSDQYWYETAANAYYPLGATDYWLFSSTSRPTTTMYEGIDLSL